MTSMTAGTIEGDVTTDDQKPVTGTVVTLTPVPAQPNRPSLYARSGIDSNGHFSFGNLSPGEYRVSAWEELEPGAETDAELLQPFESLGAKVKVGESERQQVAVTVISAARVAEETGRTEDSHARREHFSQIQNLRPVSVSTRRRRSELNRLDSSSPGVSITRVLGRSPNARKINAGRAGG